MVRRKLLSLMPCVITMIALLYVGMHTVDASPVHAGAQALVQTFQSSDNAVERRDALYAISAHIPAGTAVAPSWVSELLIAALQDECPVVVEAAVIQIGKYSLTDSGKLLIALYGAVEKRFSGSYAERVRYSIITALGKVGGAGAAELLAGLLSEDNGSDKGELLLCAIKDLSDPSLIDCVVQYRKKMEAQIAAAKQKNYDPLIYSRNGMYVQLTSDVENALRMKGGR